MFHTKKQKHFIQTPSPVMGSQQKSYFLGRSRHFIPSKKPCCIKLTPPHGNVGQQKIIFLAGLDISYQINFFVLGPLPHEGTTKLCFLDRSIFQTKTKIVNPFTQGMWVIKYLFLHKIYKFHNETAKLCPTTLPHSDQ